MLSRIQTSLTTNLNYRRGGGVSAEQGVHVFRKGILLALNHLDHKDER